MKKTIFIAAALATLAGSAAAQTAAPAAPASPHTFTGNVTVATDYRFRGISQTFRQPAIQGGFDYSHSSGFYLGNWNSNVSSVQYNNGGGIEMDLYGGYKFEIAKGVTADIGALYYYYPGATIGATGVKYNNGEIYFGATWQWLSAKYYYAVTDLFGLNATTAAAGTGTGNSKGSGYLDLTGTWEVAPKTTLTAHFGRQYAKNYGAYSYNDYKLGLAYDLGAATVGLAYYKTNAGALAYPAVTSGSTTKDVTGGTVVLSVSKTF